YGYEIKTDQFLLFFMFTVSAKAFTASLKDALENPAFKLFFLPLPIKIRFDIQTRIEGVVNEFASLAAGAAQMGLGLLVFFKLIHFSYFVIGLAGVVIFLSYKLFNEYKITLKKTLKEQKEELQGDGRRNEHNTVNVLKQEIKSTDPDRVITALKVFERLDPIEFEFSLLDQLNSKRGVIRKYAYEKLNEYLCFGALGIIKKEVKTEGNEAVLEAAEVTIANLQEAADYKLNDVSLRKLVRSTEAKDRIKGARLLSKITEDKHLTFIMELLRDINPDVRLAAMETAGKIRRPEVWPILIENLHLASYGNASMSALVHSGEAVFHNIDTSFYKTGQYKGAMLRTVQILGRVGGRQATELLWKKIDFPDKRIVSEILLSLSYIGFEARDFQAARIKIIVESRIGDIAWNIKSLQDIPQEKDLDRLIRKSIEEENVLNHNNIFMLLGMMYDAQSVLLAKDNLEAGTTDSVTFAIEMMDIFLDEELKPKIFPVMDDFKVEERLAKLQNFYPPEYFASYHDLLLQIVNRDYNRISRYTKALAMYRISQMGDVEVTDDLIANLFNPDPLLLQTAAYCIYVINKELYTTNTKRLKSAVKKELDKAILPPVFIEEGEEYHQKLLLIQRVILLKSLPAFANVPGELVTYMAEVLDEIRLKPGTRLIEKGDSGATPLYIVLDGEVEISKGEKVETRSRYAMIGESSISDSDKFDFDAVTKSVTTLLVFRKEELLDLMSKHLEIVEAILKVLNNEVALENEEVSEEDLEMSIL
ncbi:MAG: HEAT repeat domain-containing protein, partial [Cyclobacteriaceae bacterium]|nr:HEAT repeat domain-containing protein [Cyclobacteriaceae bacterium SS2]MBV6647831.1 HEAT repeat domain-containing protein [Cyclobacteriaceae bacterium HetDA_MAG_MS6]